MDICSLEGCDRPVLNKARGWCSPHYQRWQRHGDPLAGGRPRQRGAVCSINGCGKAHHSRGWCYIHYNYWKRYGDPVHTLRRRPNGLSGKALADWFWSQVRWVGQCWERDTPRTDGYDYFGIQGETVRAHRFAWATVFGDPGEQHVLHRCDNPACVRPDHLFLGDHETNMADKVAKGRARPRGRAA